jgi:MoaA/NifB/PqqE/SkfB family radical SAM enzyme
MPVSIRRPSARQLAALVTTELDRLFPKPQLRGLPSVLQVEPTNLCTLRCPLCPSGRGELSRERGFMPPQMFEQLMDETGRSLSLIILWGWGEPLLHPDLPRIIRAAKRHNVAVVTSTS